uniref:Uncharacterized protein n=1 Tax=Parascaris equorum TaxID=6256 RepID=A0A914RYV9_PAREQ
MLAALLLLPLISAHVRLLYPPSRYPSVDFIDNKRTPPPCGIAKPSKGNLRFLVYLMLSSRYH